MSYFTDRAKQLGIEVQEPGKRQPGESYFTQRARELGVSHSSPQPASPPASGSFFQNRAMDLGIVPDTRPKPHTPVATPLQPMTSQTDYKALGDDIRAKEYVQAGKERRDAQDPSNPFLKTIKDNTVDLIGEAGDRFLAGETFPGSPNFIHKPFDIAGRALNQFVHSGGNAVGVDTEAAGGAPVASTGSKILDKTAQIAGGIAGVVTNPAQIEQNLVTAPYQIAGKALATKAGQVATGAAQHGIARVANIANPALNKVGVNIGSDLTNKAAERAFTGAVAGGVQGAVNSGVRGDTDAGQVATSAVTGALLGGAADVAFGALGGLAGAIRNRFKRVGLSDKDFEDIFGFNPNRPEEPPAAVERAAEPVQPQPTARPAETKPAPLLGLPAPRVEPPTTARIARQSNPYRQQFEALIERAKQLQAEGKFTPGREDADLESLWSQMAGREAPNLDQLIDLAYKPRPNRLSPDLASQARNYQAAREVAGAPMPVKSEADRYQSGQVAEAAAPIQRIGRAPLKGKFNEPEVAAAREPETIASAPRQPEPVQEPHLAKTEPAAAQTTDDVADDITPLDDEEIAPRVRDRVTSLADNMIANARAELAKNRNRLSSNPADIYGQYAKIGAGYMLKGAVKLADFTEQMVRDFGEEIRPHVRAIFKQAKVHYKAIQKTIEAQELGLNDFEAQKLKDLSNINLNTADVYRNFKKVFADQYESVKKAVLDPFDRAKGEYAQEQKALTEKLYHDVVKGLGIKKGSKDSALVQQYGEGKISIDELRDAAPKTWKNIVQADAWFRREYDRLLDRVNDTVKHIYPNRPEKLVPKRADYYRHFQEMTALSGIKNLFDSASGKISPSLSGVSPFTTPKTKWASFKQRRGLGEFKNDAVGGFLEYIPAASYSIHIDPHISVFRNLGKRLAQDTETTANLNNFIKFLNNFANDLAGKTSPLDRWADEIGGRNGLRALTMINNRVKSNMILGNVRSTLSQLANIPNGIAYGGVDAPAGAFKTIQSVIEPNPAMQESNFLKERYLDKSFRKFDQRWWEQPRRFAEGMMEISDRVGTSFVWNTAYAKGLRQKVADPVKFADEQARRLVGGRGVGEVPLLIKSKTFNLLAPFQLEVNNLWRIMKDFVDEKRFGALVTLFTANWLLNKAFEKTTGSGVVFDPIDALYDATTEDTNFFNRFGRVGGEVLSNLPFGQSIASIYPEYGTNIAGIELPTREDFFGDKDPTRFGSGLLATKAITDPLYSFVLPFGGGQLKKTIQGSDALARGGSYTENVATTGPTIEKKKLKFPVKPSAGNTLRGLLFGPYATTEGQTYAKEDRRPLSERQTDQYLRSPDREGAFENIQHRRDIDAIRTQISDIQKDRSLSLEQKRKKIMKLQAELRQAAAQ